MRRSRWTLQTCAFFGALLLVLLAGCGSDSAPVSQAPATAASSAESAPISQSSVDAKTIGSDGYVYGLPLVMAYQVMYEQAIDSNSGQYHGPLNTLVNAQRVSTPEDTAVVTPNADTPYSFVWMDLRAEPMVVAVPAIDPSRYYSTSSAI